MSEAEKLVIREVEAAVRLGVTRREVAEVRGKRLKRGEGWGKKGKEIWLTEGGYREVEGEVSGVGAVAPGKVEEQEEVEFRVCSRPREKGWHCGNGHWVKGTRDGERAEWMWTRKASLYRWGMVVRGVWSRVRRRWEVV